ncbi:hypothetical protein BpHYR1_008689 [Brachionus plicatilis]|uniref:Uncharacterized protein n=1 Tax=Brachionus plicatilis TaxID=10195 RepID=A0A3M7RHM0_BRAPC|nr:hypothetical protein BpHYR1_008689 [Brachionus plicatilis]
MIKLDKVLRIRPKDTLSTHIFKNLELKYRKLTPKFSKKKLITNICSISEFQLQLNKDSSFIGQKGAIKYVALFCRKKIDIKLKSYGCIGSIWHMEKLFFSITIH